MMSLARWAQPWADLGMKARMELHADLRHRYSEPHRAYHTLHHIAECLQLLEQARSLALRTSEIEIALWFHDAVYDPRKTDNEPLSAEWARRELRRAGGSPEVQQRIVDLVMITSHEILAETQDQQLISDIDLAILGAGPKRYDEYERQIRREYKHVPTVLYRPGRRRILTGFLERPQIYYTDWFRERREAQARRNLERALTRLAGRFF